MSGDHRHGSPTARAAYATTIHTCEHGTTFIHMLDDKERPFAVASFTPAGLAAFVTDLLRQLPPGSLGRAQTEGRKAAH